MQFVSLIILGLVLGIQHALEPDHVIAVSTIVSKTKQLKMSFKIGLSWGIGHTVTLLVFSLMIIGLKLNIPDIVVDSLEMLVGIMIIFLGFKTLFNLKMGKVHSHTHTHDNHEHTHFHSHKYEDGHTHRHQKNSYIKATIVGMIQGLAGSGAMVVLIVATVNSFLDAIIYIMMFGVGTCVGMMISTLLIGLPFSITHDKYYLNRLFTKIAGVMSIGFGGYYVLSFII